MASAAEEFTVDNNFSPKAGTSKLQWTVPADASPDSKCPICLDKFDNVAYLGHCLHKFCFRCVQEWSKNKAECPLCKQPFQSIFHSVRAENDFEEYVLRPSYRNMNKEYVQGSFASPEGRRFRYRTTTWRRERSASAYSQRNTSLRRTETPSDSGVLFEQFSAAPIRQRDSGIHHILRQEGRSLRKIQESDMINFRRTLYRSGIRVRHIQDGGRYRDISAEFFRRNPACLHRLVPWLKRELTVLFGTHGSLVNIVQHIIMSNVTRYDLESQAFVNDLKPFLLNRTDHFLHEFISFARSPFNMEAFDQHANYDCPAPSYEEGSQSDSSVITISPDEADNQELDTNALTASQAPWDDETPGPSYSSSEQVYAAVSSPLNTSDSSDEELVRNRPQTPVGIDTNQDLNDDVDSSDNCVIVGYVKPLAERTPELVELSSDSEESEAQKNESVKKPDPSSSDSDFSRCSSPHSFVSKDGQINKSHCNSDTSLSDRILRSKKEKRSVSSSPKTLSSSVTVERVCSPCSHRLSKKRGRSRSSDSYSQSKDGHDRKSCRKHHGKRRTKSRRSRSRDSSQLKDRKDKKASRTRDNSWSGKSQTVSLSSESTVSRERSRSRSRSSDHGKRRSRSRDRERYYLRNNYTRRYQWEYTYYSRNRDGYESSYRKRTLAHYPRQSSSPEFRIQTFSERTNARKESSHNERRHYYNERRHRSRSRSSNKSRDVSVGSDRVRCEKPGGKRKYKTRHLEGTHKETEQSYEDSSKGKGECFEKSSKFGESYKNESDSFSDRSSRDRHKRRKKRARSLSVEIVYEGKTTDTSRHHKKKKKKHRRRHKRHHTSNSSQSSPIVITIETDSDKEPEVKENIESDSCAILVTQHSKKESSCPVLGPIKRKDRFTPSDGITILDKDCEITPCDSDLDIITKTVDNLPLQETSAEQTFAVRENTFVSDMVNLHSDIESIQTEPSVHLPSPKISVIETSPERPSLILRLPKHIIEKSCIGPQEKT